MKKKLLFLLFISFSLTVQSQEKHTYYLTSEVNFGNYLGVDYALNYVYNNTYSVKVGFSGNVREPKSQPKDYDGGGNALFSSGTDNPYDHFLTYKIDVGRIYKLNEKGTIRANISAGVGYTIIKEPGNWQFVGNSNFFEENYSYSYHTHNAISLVVNPKIEFPITKYFGFSASPMLQINKNRTYYGIGVGLMLGKLR